MAKPKIHRRTIAGKMGSIGTRPENEKLFPNLYAIPC